MSSPIDRIEEKWEREEGVTCVSCPRCAFTFDASHVTQTTGRYDCPCCENEALVNVAKAADTLAGRPFGQLNERDFYALREALSALSGPDTPADSQEDKT